MTRIALPLLLVACVILAAPAGFAACPTAPTGPHYFGISTWYDYGPDDACWDDDINGALTPIEPCNGTGGWDHGYGYTSAAYEFDVLEDEEEVLENWWVSFSVNFNDPNNSSFNWVRLKAYVTHNSTTTPSTIYLHNGGTGDLNCDIVYTHFNAVAGDHVRLLLETNNWYEDTVIETSFPHIENSYP